MSKKYFASLKHGFFTQKSGAKTSFFIEKNSQKPLAVLIHGFGGNAFGMSFLAKEMSTNWRILILEIPNHGKSDLQGIQTAADFREWNSEIIDQIEHKFGKISLLVCHSLSCFSVGKNISAKITTALINPVFEISANYNLGVKLTNKSKIFALFSNFHIWSPIKATFLIKHWSKKSIKNVLNNTIYSSSSPIQIIFQSKMANIPLEKPLLDKNSQPVKFLIIGELDKMSRTLSNEWKSDFFPQATVINFKTGHLLPIEIPKAAAKIFNQK